MEEFEQLLKNYEILLNRLPCGICKISLDENLTILIANTFYYQLYGYTESQAREEGFTCVRHILPASSFDKIRSQIMENIEHGKYHFELEFQGIQRQGQLHWMLVSCVYDPSDPDSLLCVLLDISKRKETEDQLRMSMDENRMAFALTDKYMYVYDAETKVLIMPSDASDVFGLPTVVENVPYSLAKSGAVAEESVKDYLHFYESILQGVPSGEAVAKKRRKDGSFGWFSAKFSTVYGQDGNPKRGIIACEDITERYEKELVYKKWTQYFSSQQGERLGYYEYNLSKNTFNLSSGDFPPDYLKNLKKYTDHMIYIGEHFVVEEDREKFYHTFKRGNLLSRYYQGDCGISLEYQRKKPDGTTYWSRASIQLISEPYTNDIIMFLITYDINEEKMQELNLQIQARTDAMTGLLNRSAFISRVNEILSKQDFSIRHALIMMDIDHFKELNDTLGHGFGDQVITETAELLKKSVRRTDFCGRLGGDEFVIFLNELPTEDAAEKKMKFLCKTLKKEYSNNLRSSVSLGLAFYPKDGLNFEDLYKKADIALYAAKKSGRSNCLVYCSSMDNS